MRSEREGEWKIRDWQVMQVVTERKINKGTATGSQAE